MKSHYYIVIYLSLVKIQIPGFVNVMDTAIIQ